MRKIFLILTVLLAASLQMAAQGQFKTNTPVSSVPGADASSSEYVEDDEEAESDTLQGFSMKHLFRGLSGKEPLTPAYATLGSIIMPGSVQAFNKDYWKMPIFYGTIGAGVAGGLIFNSKYHQTGEKKYATFRNISYATSALMYWAEIMDGVRGLEDTRTPDPGKAAVYSALLPGLGQAYNGDWWHIPIWYSGLAVCGYTIHLNSIQYKRYHYIYKMALEEGTGYDGHITLQQAEVYKDMYHRYRDYSYVATLLVYALNIIDANVFAYMNDFNVSDELSLNLEPALIDRLNSEYIPDGYEMPSFGVHLTLNF